MLPCIRPSQHSPHRSSRSHDAQESHDHGDELDGTGLEPSVKNLLLARDGCSAAVAASDHVQRGAVLTKDEIKVHEVKIT